MSDTETTFHPSSYLGHRLLLLKLRCREIDLLERYAQQLEGSDRRLIESVIDWLEELADEELVALKFDAERKQARIDALAGVRHE